MVTKYWRGDWRVKSFYNNLIQQDQRSKGLASLPGAPFRTLMNLVWKPRGDFWKLGVKQILTHYPKTCRWGWGKGFWNVYPHPRKLQKVKYIPSNLVSSWYLDILNYFWCRLQGERKTKQKTKHYHNICVTIIMMKIVNLCTTGDFPVPLVCMWAIFMQERLVQPWHRLHGNAASADLLSPLPVPNPPSVA